MMNYLHVRRVIILSFAVLYLTNSFLKSSYISILCSFLLAYIVISALPELPKANLLVSMGIFILGSILLIYQGASSNLWLAALSNNSGLVTLFIAVPLFGLPFFFENYQDDLKALAVKYMTNVWVFCLLVAAVSHLLGVLLSIGAIALIYELFKNNARLYRAEKPFLAAIYQGYIATGFWSPAWASMIVVTENLHLEWLELIPLGLVFALGSIALSLFILKLTLKRSGESYPNLKPDYGAAVNLRRIYTLLGLLLGLIVTIIFFDHYTTWQILVIIPVVALLYPIFSALIMGKFPQLKIGFINYYDKTLLRIKNEVVLFTAAGFLGKSLELSGIARVIPQLLPPWLIKYPFLLLLFLMSIMVAASLCGIHPVVSGSALVGTINPGTIGLSVVTFAFTILSGWSVSILLSPFSATSLITSGLTGIPSWDISLRINGPFGLILLIMLALTLTLLLPVL
jgi:DcuC family C4-dicarboxylate transporter